MKHTKRIASLLLALVMVFALAIPAFADETKGTITIQNTVKDADYTIYRIFDLESYAGSNNDDAHSYRVVTKWKAYFETGAEGRSYFDVDENGYVTYKKDADLVEFTEKALAYATAQSIESDRTEKGTGADIKFENLELGYYLIKSSVGALCALTTTDPDGVVIEKNSNPSLNKEVKENSTNSWEIENDANIGDTVEFKATITVQGYAKDYVMHDTMDDGLTYKEVTGVTLNDEDATATTDYTVTAPGTDGCTFDVIFTETFCEELKSGDVIVVYYTATLNENAVAGEAENNNAHLSYTDKNNTTQKTEESKTETYTWKMPVLKYANGVESNVLAGAKFSLYTDKDCTADNIIKFTAVEGTTTYRVDAEGTVTEITTDSTGKFTIVGLDSGTYYLKEVEAPKGYNILNTVVKVTITNEGEINVDDEEKEGAAVYVEQVSVNNNSGVELPETGGIGTTVFYVVGSVLVVGAAVLLITKKRMSSRG